MIVDAHQHFWRLDRGDYGWLQPQLGVLYRDYLPQHLAPLLDANGVGATVLVQAAATEDETHYLLELAAAQPFVAGVVGWVELDAPNAPERIRALVDSSRGCLKGLRPMLQNIADANWVLRPQLDASFEAMIEQGLTFDALVKPQHLQSLLRRLRRHPRLKAVIDHVGKPDIASGGFKGWSEDIERHAGETSVCCKLSGLVTEAGTADLDVLDQYVAHVLACFGPKRVLWGSDWPVLNRVCSYGEWLALARELVQRHARGDDASIFGGNAIEFYSLTVMPSATERNRLEVSG